MSKRSIQFACVLFTLAAILAVSAQENTTALNNATMNNTTLLNNTTLIEAPVMPIETANDTAPAQVEVIAAQNETALAPETTPSENATASVETIPAIPVLQPGMQIGSTQRTTFAIGGTGRTPNLFSINGKALAQGAYEIGLPAKTIMDLSALSSFDNKI